jgi:SanA protein
MTMILRLLILLVTLLIGCLFYIRYDIHKYDELILTSPTDLETGNWERPRVAVVFGASVLGNRVLSPVLADRVKTAIDLYQAGKVDRILVSGDNRHPSYNEPKAMYEYLVSHSIPARDILVDNSGRSTYETCLRARQVFGLRRAVLVSQGFHLPRALFIANELGLSSIGMAGDLRLGNQFGYLNVREVAAEFKAWFNVRISPPAELKQNRGEPRRQPVGQTLHRWRPRVS